MNGQDPRNAYLQSLGLRMMANSGPSLTPVSTASQIGKAGLGAAEDMKALMQQQMQMKMAEKKLGLMDMQLSQAERQQKMEQQNRQWAQESMDRISADKTQTQGQGKVGGEQQAQLTEQAQGFGTPNMMAQEMQGLGMRTQNMPMFQQGMALENNPLKQEHTQAQINKLNRETRLGGGKDTRPSKQKLTEYIMGKNPGMKWDDAFELAGSRQSKAMNDQYFDLYNAQIKSYKSPGVAKKAANAEMEYIYGDDWTPQEGKSNDPLGWR